MIIFDKDCSTPLAEELISLYAQYVEGYIEGSRLQYNEKIRTATEKDIVYMIYRTPFNRHAVQLAEVNKFDLPEEVRVKLEIDKEWIKKMDLLMTQ
jgi:hypothetical protein